MKLLVVAPDFPYPPNHGGRVDTWVRLRVLAQLGHTVDLLVTSKIMPNESEVSMVKNVVRNVWLLERHNRPWHLISTKPLQAVSRSSLAAVRLSEQYDVTWLEGEYVEPVLNNPTLKSRRIFMRLHNDEYAYFRQLSSSTRNPLKWLYYKTEAQKFRGFSRRLYQKTDKLFFISIDELNNFTNQDPDLKAKSVLLPAPLSKNRFDPPRLGQYVLFVGSLFMPNNQEAILWYLQQVHPHITHRSYRLIIAGNSRGESLSWLHKAVTTHRNVQIFDSPPDLDPLYAKSCIFINPMRLGAGVKLKTLEAIQNGLALVSTTKGAEGTGLEAGRHFLLADEPRDFASAIEKLLDDKAAQIKLITQGQQFLCENYDHKSILERELVLQNGAVLDKPRIPPPL